MSAPLEQLLALADRLAPGLRVAFLRAIEQLRRELTSTEVGNLIGGAHPTASELWHRLQALLDPAVREPITRLLTAAGTQALGELPESVQAQVRFDLTNPRAVEAVDTLVRASVQEIANASQDAVQTILKMGFQQGWTVDTMARRLRAVIGLTDRYATAVEKYREMLLGSQNAAKANELADAYARRLLRQRATTIARTESIRAMNAGQQAAWQDAIDQHLLAPDVRQEWIVTDDDRLCPICEAIPALNPEGVPLGHPFQSPLGSLSGPPAHVACRCAVAIAQGVTA